MRVPTNVRRSYLHVCDMALPLKPIPYLAAAEPVAEDPSQVAPRILELLVRRVAGDGVVNLLRAKAEVDEALWSCAGAIPSAPPIDDALPAAHVPSVMRGSTEDRVLAEIDQDGFAFALDPLDAQLFNQRPRGFRRQQNLIDVALLDGRVCVRKRVRGPRIGARQWGDRRIPPSLFIQRCLWSSLGLYLYTEAAALLRLRDLPFVPRLRAIDFADRALYVDYVQGENLRTQAARAGAAVHDRDVKDHPDLSRWDARALERREVELLERAGGGDFRREIRLMANEISARGVAPLDVKLGNFIRGARTGRLYWIDFEIARLQSQPRWQEDLAAHGELLEGLLDVSTAGHAPA
jgi:hypothetical protein